MSRVEVIGDATLYLGDCREILPTLNGVDHVMTDPPYGEQTHAGARTRNDDDPGRLIDFASIDADEFVRLCEQFCDIAARWVVTFCDWRHAAAVERARPELLVRVGVWVKPNGAPQFTGDRPAMGWEAVSILHRPGRYRWNGGGGRAVWDVPRPQGNHPTEKPLALVGRWVDLFTDPGELIADPFMGSGTTGVAALRAGRRFVGCERKPEYFETACRRIDEAARAAALQPRLIAERGPALVQPSIFGEPA